jgi:phage replication-related protein YjqB (UPF0714/DUF867 family)
VFDELLAHPGVEEDVHLRSRFGFMAFHGGSLEEMTDVIAAEAAELAGASLYAVRQPNDFQWHIPSNKIDPAHSNALASFIDHVDVVVTVHGFGRMDMWTTLLLGGGNRALAQTLGASLAASLPEYEVVHDIDQIPSALRGMHPANPVNLPSGGGVQLELPPRVRGMGPFWANWDGAGLTPHTEALIEGLAATAQSSR